MEASNNTLPYRNSTVAAACPYRSLGTLRKRKGLLAPKYANRKILDFPARAILVLCCASARQEPSLSENIGTIDPYEFNTCTIECSRSHAPASLSRAVGLLKPSSTSQFIRLARQRPVSSPTSILSIVLTAVLSAAMAAVRAATIRRARACTDCKGYGIQRCKFCGGDGVKSWEGKYFHQDEPCPVCFGERYTKCHSCGGNHPRLIFGHAKNRRFSWV